MTDEIRCGEKQERSQVDCIGAPLVKTWDDYRRGCQLTYGGGHDGAELEAFQHGMDTIFNLLEAEFPPAEVCKAAQSATARWREVSGGLERQVAWIDRDARHVAVVVKGRGYILTLPTLPAADNCNKEAK